MQPILPDDFLGWARAAGIGLDERYPGAGSLSFLPPRALSRFWTLPGDPATWTHFAATFFEGLDPWSHGFVWPRAGHARSREERVRVMLLRGVGVPGDWGGALRFQRGEEDTLVAVLFVFLAFAWCTDDDLFFVPDHARQIIRTDHHDVVHIEFAGEGRLHEFVAHMARAGHDLPTEPPDATFKRPPWMGEAPG
jgi:hypothetical protein